MDVLGYYGNKQVECGTAMAVRPPSFSERVDASVAHAEQRLADLKRMKEIFAKHPEFEELLTLVQRGHI